MWHLQQNKRQPLIQNCVIEPSEVYNHAAMLKSCYVSSVLIYYVKVKNKLSAHKCNVVLKRIMPNITRWTISMWHIKAKS